MPSTPCEPGLPWGSAAPLCPFTASFLRRVTGQGTRSLPSADHSSSAPRPPTPLADRAFSTFPSFGSVGAWLDALDLGRYKDNFAAAGYGSLEAVAAMAAQ